MSEARQPIFVYFLLRVKPGVSCGTMKLEISGLPSERVPVTAVIVVPPLMSVPRVRDERLGAVDDPLAVVAARPCVCTLPGIAAGVGFGQAEAPQHLALRERDEVLLLLLLGAEQIERAWRRARRARPS